MSLNFLWVVFPLYVHLTGRISAAPRPEFVKIGALFSFDSTNGRVANIAMHAAIEDVNSDASILGGTKLNLSTHNSNYSTFFAIVGGLQYMEDDIVAIIGPQVSKLAHILSRLANKLHVPMLSFTALDPSLSSLQYPYFIQTAPNDLFQMTAIADMISYFGYREVIAMYTDDEQSRGSINSLGDKLFERRCRISYKAVLSPEGFTTRSEITNELLKVRSMESRVIIVHSYAVIGLQIFDVALELGMMESGHVWISTAWLSTFIDSRGVSTETSKTIQGVLTVRPHTPDSEKKNMFVARWKKLSNGSIGLNPYGLYAYDTVWMIANAVKALLDHGGTISFTRDSNLNGSGEGKLNLGSLSTFVQGEQLLNNILQTNMKGLTGQIAFDSDKHVILPSFDILNVIGRNYKQIGYWSNHSRLSVVPPENLYSKAPNLSSSNQQLYDVMWPGGTTVKPRGWGFPHSGKKLLIGVPNRVSFKDFVSKDENTNKIHGYCIDVFRTAINLLPYALPHKFILFGDGHENPSYTDFVHEIKLNVVDAVVGDISIVTNRTRIVDFSQPYIESGLVVVAPVKKLKSSAWAFMQPFTLLMWSVTGAFFLIVAAVVWVLEHRLNDDFRGPPKKQIITILWFGFSTMFFSHRENTVSTLGRAVVIIWLFVVFIVTSSYTASLTSILTIQQLTPSIRGIESLISSNDHIGFQVGSFVENYLSEELSIAKSRLVPLGSPEEYADALDTGRVAAIIDERPYVDLFLSDFCRFQVVGREFTKNGWGFAFPRNSPLVIDLSTAILTLSESGELQKIRDKWFYRRGCGVQSSDQDPYQLQLESFSGLFIICGMACIVALLIHFSLIVNKFRRHLPHDLEPSMNGSSRSQRIQRFLSFADEKEKELKNRLKRKETESLSRGGTEIQISNGIQGHEPSVFLDRHDSNIYIH